MATIELYNLIDIFPFSMASYNKKLMFKETYYSGIQSDSLESNNSIEN